MGKCADCGVKAGFLNDLCQPCATNREIRHDKSKISKSFNDTNQEESTPIELANKVIRKANVRVHELKCMIEALEGRIILCEFEKESLLTENYKLKDKLKEGSSMFSELQPYEILGFEYLPDQQDLRKKYKKLSLIYHPDRGGSKKMMHIINQANIKLK